MVCSAVPTLTLVEAVSVPNPDPAIVTWYDELALSQAAVAVSKKGVSEVAHVKVHAAPVVSVQYASSVPFNMTATFSTPVARLDLSGVSAIIYVRVFDTMMHGSNPMLTTISSSTGKFVPVIVSLVPPRIEPV